MKAFTTTLAALALAAAGTAITMQALRAEPAGVTAAEAARLADRAVSDHADELVGALDRLERRLAGLRSADRDLESRLAAMDARLGERPVPEGPAPAAVDAPSAAHTSLGPKAARDELESLRRAVMGGDSTAEELQRFLDLARSDGLVDGMISELETASEERPSDVELRMELADAYLTKLMAVPGGPEQGVWGMKAEAQWQSVLALDEDHWDARHNLAYSWSMWPEFLGKTGAAIEQYESLVASQESHASEARHAVTYLELSRLYQRRGDADSARRILEQGRELHPDSDELAKALRTAPGGKEER